MPRLIPERTSGFKWPRIPDGIDKKIAYWMSEVARTFQEQQQGFAYGARVTKSAVQSIPDATDTVVTWNTREYDSRGFWSSAATSVLTARETGLYYLFASSTWAGNSTGIREIQLLVDGVILTEDRRTASAASQATIGIGAYLKVGQQVSVQVRQTSGGPLDFDTASHFGIHYFGPYPEYGLP